MRSQNRYLRWSAAAVILGAAAHAGCSEALPDAPSLDATESAVVGAQSASFQDGVAPTSSYAGTRDTMLEEHAKSETHGGDTSLSISGDTPEDSGDDDVALLRWDVSASILQCHRPLRDDQGHGLRQGRADLRSLRGAARLGREQRHVEPGLERRPVGLLRRQGGE